MSQTLKSLVDYAATGKAHSVVTQMLAEGDHTRVTPAIIKIVSWLYTRSRTRSKPPERLGPHAWCDNIRELINGNDELDAAFAGHLASRATRLTISALLAMISSLEEAPSDHPSQMALSGGAGCTGDGVGAMEMSTTGDDKRSMSWRASSVYSFANRVTTRPC